MAKLIPQQGGCWFCAQDDEFEELLFDCEWDTCVHANCIRKALDADPEHPEAILMKYLIENGE